MGHIISKNYYNLQKRLDDAVQGAPSSESLFKILKILFTEKEAGFVSVLPLNFFTAKEAAESWKKSEKESKKILDGLADKGILLDLKKGKTQAYILAPTMAGFFELALMRTKGKVNKKVLSELFYQYIDKEDDFIKRVFMVNPPIARVFVQEKSLKKSSKDKIVILDYEKATQIIKTASCITVSTCFCRHKMEHLGKACNNPQEVCLTFNKAAESLVRHNIARRITKKEALKILNKCINLGLIQIGDNIQEEINWMCNCCSCCCDVLNTYKRLGYRMGLTSNFVSKNNTKKCIGCGKCVIKCPVHAIKIQKTKAGRKYAKIDSSKCIGCGVCLRFCSQNSLSLVRRDKLAIVPKDSFERTILSAIDKGKLQNYIFDNYNLLTHDILRRFLGVILSLKASKKLLANKQLQSRFINRLTKTKKYTIFDKLYHERNQKIDYNHKELDKIKK